MKIMIIDDELVICQKLYKLITESGLPFSSVEMAQNAFEALDKINRDQPQIILTDIRMPGKSGIEIAQYIYEKNLPVIVIILSGYSDFKYAKSAIQFHVFDYILKPIENEKVILLLKKAIQEFCQREKERELNELFQTYFKDNQENIRRQFIEKILLRPELPNQDYIESQRVLLGLEVKSYRISATRYVSSDAKWKENIFYSYLIEKELKESFNGQVYTQPFGNLLYSIIPIESANSLDPLYGVFLELHEKLEIDYSLSLTTGISAPSSMLSEIQSLRQQTAYCLEKAETSCDKVVFFEDLSFGLQKNINSAKAILQIVSLLRQGRKEETMQSFSSLMKETAHSDPEFRNYVIRQIVSNILFFIEDRKLSAETMLYIRTSIKGVLQGSISSPDKEISFSYWLEYICDLCSDDTESSNNLIIQQIYEFLNNNYSRAIGLTDVADHVNRNASYISRLMKQETGRNFTQILTDLRIEKAKLLLKSTNMKAAEIALSVGYPNAKYFSRIFSDKVGMTPLDYRKISTAFD